MSWCRQTSRGAQMMLSVSLALAPCQNSCSSSHHQAHPKDTAATSPVLSQAASQKPTEAHLRPGEFRPGPPFGDLWCLGDADRWLNELAPHFPPEAKTTSNQDEPHDCHVDGYAGVQSGAFVTWSISCGDAQFGDKKWHDGDDFEEATPNSAVPEASLVWVDTQISVYVHAHDLDTPCHVVTRAGFWSDGQLEPRAIALAKDILERLTPERISEPRAELVTAAIDDDGTLARAELANWDVKRQALKGFADLSPGYPKVVTHADYPALPEGKPLLSG